MPLIQDLRQATTPVSIKHGQHTFNLDCALEKESQTPETAPDDLTEGTTFQALQEESYGLEIEGSILQGRAAGIITELQALGREDAATQIGLDLELARNAKLSAQQKKKAPAITFEEIEAEANRRADDIQKRLDATREEADKNRSAQKLNKARQIAFLVAGSDMEVEAGKPALCQQVNKTPEQLEADARVFFSLSDLLLGRIHVAVTEAVDGPLVTGG